MRSKALAVVCLVSCFAFQHSAPGGDGPLPALTRGPCDAREGARPEVRRRIVEDFGAIPLFFIENKGQVDDRVLFYESGAGRSVFFTQEEAVFSLRKGVSHTVLRLSALGGNREAEVLAEAVQEGRINTFIGNDPSRWRTDIPTYGKVRYKGIYPGVDLVYYGTGRQMEFDFEIAPGADASRIGLGLKGADRLELTSRGDLEVFVGQESILYKKPVAYQELDGARCEIDCSFRVEEGGKVGFSLAAYDPTRALVIDPVLAYSTYLGGSSWDEAEGIAADPSGNVYVTGYTYSSDFPVNEPPSSDNRYAFVSKFDPVGSRLMYSTYLGGWDWPSETVPHAIAVDASGCAYVTGKTSLADFPTKNAFQTVRKGSYDAFVTKLNATGNTLLYSTYLGGTEGFTATGFADEAHAIAVDASGCAYVTGITESADFPTKNAVQTVLKGYYTAFVTKFTPAGNALVYSTYLGGSQGDEAHAIAVDVSGRASVAGITYSSDFPTKKAFQSTNKGQSDAFIAQLPADGGALIYSTFFGGRSEDRATGIALDALGNVYITGWTSSSEDFPIKNAFQNRIKGYEAAFISKLNPAGTSLVYSTYLGGSEGQGCNGIAVDVSGNAYVTGSTRSIDFPVKKGYQNELKGDRDLFITKLDPTGKTLLYSTYLGGSNYDESRAIAVDPSGNIYAAGGTSSFDFPTKNPFQSEHAGTATSNDRLDAFVTKLLNPAPAMDGLPLGPAGGKVDASILFTASATDPEKQPLKARFDWGDGILSPWSSDFSQTHSWTSAGDYCIKAQAMNSGGAQSEWSPCATLTITHPPVMSGPPEGMANGKVRRASAFTASAVDPDGDPLSYRFDWGDGNVSGWADSASASHAWSQGGKYCVKAQAKDSHGMTSEWSACKAVAINGAPTVAGPPSGPAAAAVGEAVTFSTTEAKDPENNVPLQYRFQWGDRTFSRWSTELSASHAWTRPGTFCVRVQAKDSRGIFSEWSGCSALLVGN